MREREEIKAKVILEAKREIVQMLCCTPAFITCAPPRRCQRRRRQRHYVRIEEEKKGAKKKRFLLMNKGNFIFCLSFRMALTTLYSVMCYSFFFATICDRLQSRYGNGKREKKTEETAREKVERETKRILFPLLFPSQSSLGLSLALDLDQENMCLRINTRVKREDSTIKSSGRKNSSSK